MFYVYVIRCEDNSLYTGYTTDIERRINEHFTRDKKGAKYTKSHKLKSLEMIWECESKSVAMSLEYFFKSLKKVKKEDIIKNPQMIFDISQDKFRGKIISCKKTIDRLNFMC